MAKKKDSVLSDFIPEAEELLEVLHKSLQEIETLPDPAQVRPDTINAIFRAAHTLKGMSGMVGLNKVSELSHHFEDMLDKVRMGKLPLSRDVLDVLMDGVGLLQSMIESASQGKGEVDASSLEERIAAILSGKPIESGSKPLENVDLDPSILKVLTEYESHRLFENIKSDSPLYEVKATFKLETFDTDLSALNQKIQKIGEIITTLPNVSPSSQGGMEFKLLVGAFPGSPPFNTQIAEEHILVREISKKPKEGGTASQQIPPAPSSAPEADHIPAQSSAPSESGSIRSMTQTVRVDIQKLDALLNMVGELVLSKAVVNQI